MTVAQLAQTLDCRVAAARRNLGREVTGVYTGDLLSWVMSHAKTGDAWVTVMGNVNVAAVAVLVGVACVALADGARPDAELLARAEERGVPLLLSGRGAAEIVRRIGELP